MSMYPIKELLKRWKLGQLTAEQAIGHLLQNLQALEKRVEMLEWPPKRSLNNKEEI